MIFWISEKGQFWKIILGKKTPIGSKDAVRIFDSNDVWHLASKVVNRLPIMKKACFWRPKKSKKKFSDKNFFQTKKIFMGLKVVPRNSESNDVWYLAWKSLVWSAGSNLQGARKTSQPAKPVDFRSVVPSLGKLKSDFAGEVSSCCQTIAKAGCAKRH